MSRAWKLPALALLALASGLAGCSGPGVRGNAAGTGEGTAEPAARVGSLTPAEARSFLASHPEALLLDVRTPEEWNDDLGHIEGARLVPLPELARHMEELAGWKDRPVVAVCRVGGRSRRAAGILAAAGFRQVFNLEGGMAAWRRAGF